MVYLVDLENIQKRALDLLELLTENDRMYILYTNNTIAKDKGSQKFSGFNNVELIKCQTGKNALDTVLATVLGALANENPQEQYRIASNDKGFDAVLAYWREKDLNIARIPMTTAEKKLAEKKKPLKKTTQIKKKDKSEKEEIKTLVSEKGIELQDEQMAALIEIFKEEKKKRASVIFNNILKNFGEEGRTIYKSLKPSFKKIYKCLNM